MLISMRTEKLDARFRVKRFQELAENNASSPTVQLQSIRIASAVAAYRKWNFRAMGVSRAFLTSKHSERNTYVKLPDVAEQEMRPGNYKTPVWSKYDM